MRPYILLAIILVLFAGNSYGQYDTSSFPDFEKVFVKDKKEKSFRNLEQFIEERKNVKEHIETDIAKTEEEMRALLTPDTGLINQSISKLEKLNDKNPDIIRFRVLPIDIQKLLKEYNFTIEIDTLYRIYKPDDTISINEIIDVFKNRIRRIRDLSAKLTRQSSDLKYLTNEISKATAEEDNKYAMDTHTMLISIIFSIIIALLLIGFFFLIFFKSESAIAKDFLSGSGLQFMALFALIICIAMFGVLEIIDGKELATMLSAIAGFILGKGYPEKSTKSAGAIANLTLTLEHYDNFEEISLSVNNKTYGKILKGVKSVPGLSVGTSNIELKMKDANDKETSKKLTVELKEGDNNLFINLH